MLAAIDLGSNSFRLHIGRHNGELIEVVRSAREPTRLAAGLEPDGALGSSAVQRALEALDRLSEVLRAYPLDSVRAVATNTLRVATNAADFLPAAERALGHPIEVISGEEEARLIYLGIANQIASPGERRLVIDIGGGSTELILGRGQEIERAESIGIGTFGQSQQFFQGGRIDEAAFDAAILHARSRFQDVFAPQQKGQWKKVYGSSGTMRAIAEIIERNNLNGETLTLRSLDALKRALIAQGSVHQLQLEKLRPERADSVVGGLAILMGAMQELQIAHLSPIDGGLRLGVMWDLHLRATRRDRRDLSVRGFMQRFSVDEVRASRVAEFATAFYAQIKSGGDAYQKLLEWGALLHEVGLAVSPTNFHKHGAYLIENADLPGFTTREQRAMGKLVLGQKGNLRKLGGALTDPETVRAVLALRLAAMCMHANIDTDFGGMRLKVKSRIELELSERLKREYPTLPYWLEREREFWKEVGMDFSVRSK